MCKICYYFTAKYILLATTKHTQGLLRLQYKHRTSALMVLLSSKYYCYTITNSEDNEAQQLAILVLDRWNISINAITWIFGLQ